MRLARPSRTQPTPPALEAARYSSNPYCKPRKSGEQAARESHASHAENAHQPLERPVEASGRAGVRGGLGGVEIGLAARQPLEDQSALLATDQWVLASGPARIGEHHTRLALTADRARDPRSRIARLTHARIISQPRTTRGREPEEERGHAGFPYAPVIPCAPYMKGDELRPASAARASGVLAAALALCLLGCGWKPPGRVILIGIDGATLRIASPLLEAGRLPNLKRIADAGASGALRSFVPLFSPRIWTTIATGKVPEKHGIAGFTFDDGDGQRLYLSLHRESSALWNIVSDAGGVVGVVNWWNTYPPDNST